MDLKQQLQQDLKEAMRAQDQQQRVHVIRLLMAALEKTQEAQDLRSTLRDQNMRTVMPLGSEVKPVHLVEFGDKSQ